MTPAQPTAPREPGGRVLRTRALTVVTSARRDARAPHGFGDYLAGLDAEADTALA